MWASGAAWKKWLVTTYGCLQSNKPYMIGQRNHDIRYNVVLHPYIFVNIAILRSGATSEGLASQDIHIPDFFKFVGLSGQKIWQNGFFWYFVLHRKSEMQLVCQNDHGQLGITFCFKWHLLLKHATVSIVILLIIVFL